MNLLNLPLDLLKQLVPFIGIYDLEALYQTSKVVQNLLRTPGVLEEASFAVTPLRPRLGRWLHGLEALRRVRIRVASVQHSGPNHIQGLLRFTPNLTALEISTGNASYALCDCIMEKNKESGRSSLVENIWPFGIYFPTLKRLFISSGTMKARLTHALSALPHSLTELSLEFASSYRGNRDLVMPSIAALTSLQTLKLVPFTQFEDEESYNLDKLQNLTSLHLPFFNRECLLPNATITSATLPYISSRLLRLISDTCETLKLQNWGIAIPFSYSSDPTPPIMLPPRLTHLEIMIADSLQGIVSLLPASLTSLEVWTFKKTSPQDELQYLSLPKGLKHFSSAIPSGHSSHLIGLLREIGVENPKTLFPPSLTTLRNRIIPTPADPGWLDILPSSLRTYSRSFSIISPEYEKIDFASKLPHLHTLELRAYANDFLDDTDLILCKHITVPPTLTRLSIEAEILRSPHSRIRPSRGEDGKMAFKSFLDTLEELPETLKTLKVKDDYYPQSLACIPSKLQIFHGKFACHLFSIVEKNGRVVSRESAPESFVASLCTLPRMLTSLSLSIRLTIPADRIIPTLPRTLLHIELFSLDSFENRHASLLSPGLLSLSIRHSEHFGDEGFAALPRTIDSIDMRLNRKLTPKIFDFFLPALTELLIPRNRNFRHALRSMSKLKAIRGLKIKTKKLRTDNGYH